MRRTTESNEKERGVYHTTESASTDRTSRAVDLSTNSSETTESQQPAAARTGCRTKQYHIQRALDGSNTSQEEVPESVLEIIASGGTPLETAIQREFEQRMETRFDQVRIHTGPAAAEAADAIGARAFTCGNDIVFNAGEYDPDSPEGKQLLAHELAHVEQQTDGAISMKPQPDAELEIDPDPQLEREADEAAQRVVSGEQLGIQRMSDTEFHIQRAGRGWNAFVDGLNNQSPKARAENAADRAKQLQKEVGDNADNESRSRIDGNVQNAKTAAKDAKKKQKDGDENAAEENATKAEKHREEVEKATHQVPANNQLSEKHALKRNLGVSLGRIWKDQSGLWNNGNWKKPGALMGTAGTGALAFDGAVAGFADHGRALFGLSDATSASTSALTVAGGALVLEGATNVVGNTFKSLCAVSEYGVKRSMLATNEQRARYNQEPKHYVNTEIESSEWMNKYSSEINTSGVIGTSVGGLMGLSDTEVATNAVVGTAATILSAKGFYELNKYNERRKQDDQRNEELSRIQSGENSGSGADHNSAQPQPNEEANRSVDPNNSMGAMAAHGSTTPQQQDPNGTRRAGNQPDGSQSSGEVPTDESLLPLPPRQGNNQQPSTSADTSATAGTTPQGEGTSESHRLPEPAASQHGTRDSQNPGREAGESETEIQEEPQPGASQTPDDPSRHSDEQHSEKPATEEKQKRKNRDNQEEIEDPLGTDTDGGGNGGSDGQTSPQESPEGGAGEGANTSEGTGQSSTEFETVQSDRSQELDIEPAATEETADTVPERTNSADTDESSRLENTDDGAAEQQEAQEIDGEVKEDQEVDADDINGEVSEDEEVDADDINGEVSEDEEVEEAVGDSATVESQPETDDNDLQFYDAQSDTDEEDDIEADTDEAEDTEYVYRSYLPSPEWRLPHIHNDG